MATPVGTLLSKLTKPSPKLVIQNMKAFGEGETITRYPELIDAQVIAGNDKAYASTSKDLLMWVREQRRSHEPLKHPPQVPLTRRLDSAE